MTSRDRTGLVGEYDGTPKLDPAVRAVLTSAIDVLGDFATGTGNRCGETTPLQA